MFVPRERFRVPLAIAVVLPNDTQHLSRNQLMRGHPDKWSQPLTQLAIISFIFWAMEFQEKMLLRFTDL